MATATAGFSIDPNDFYRPCDLCELLGVSPRTVTNWLNPPAGRRRLRCWRQGGKAAFVVIRGKWLIDFFNCGEKEDDTEEEADDQG